VHFYWNFNHISSVFGNIKGLLKKGVSGVPCLRRSGFAQAGRPFVVLTYYEYAPRVKGPAALLSAPF